jgi:broad specificity phosphatase PhoE
MKNQESASFERREEELRLIGRITILRHGQTRYTNEFPDLTELGKETIAKSAEQIASGLDPDEEIAMYSSDRARAQGSASIIKERIGHSGEINVRRSIGQTHFKDPQKAQEIFDAARGGFNKYCWHARYR